jgi:hypothetical protein
MILYFPYFESPIVERHEEILICLQENINNKYIKKNNSSFRKTSGDIPL